MIINNLLAIGYLKFNQYYLNFYEWDEDNIFSCNKLNLLFKGTFYDYEETKNVNLFNINNNLCILNNKEWYIK